jgi:hypothetical protein
MPHARPNNVTGTTAFAPDFQAKDAPETPNEFAEFLKKWLDPIAVERAIQKASR